MPDGTEQNPADWWSATQPAFKALPAAEGKAVYSGGLSGQMHWRHAASANDKVLRPAILWNDGRSEQQCPRSRRTSRAQRDITGNIAMPGFTAPKLVWVRENEPAVFKDTRCVLLPKDYVAAAHDGEKARDVRTPRGPCGWTSQSAAGRPKCWPRRASIESHMPRLVEGSDVTGTLRKEVAADWGMDACRGGGGGDNALAPRASASSTGDAFCRLALGRAVPGHAEDSCRTPPRRCTPSVTACRASGTR
jgi:xylulokinase